MEVTLDFMDALVPDELLRPGGLWGRRSRGPPYNGNTEFDAVVHSIDAEAYAAVKIHWQ